jgi:ribose transport system substrate-binding protein
MLATADFNAMQMASLAAECAARHLRGEPVPARIELPVQIVDASNYAQWNLPYEQRPVITLEQLRRPK